MKKIAPVVAGGTLCLLAGSYLALAEAAAERHPMTFFVTSVGVPGGANLHGLAGADAHCLDLASAVGAGNHTWRAYLSTEERPGQPAIHARDRIGAGPWYNANGVMIAKDLDELHGENNLHRETTLTEQGQMNPGNGSPADPNDKSWAYMQVHPYSIRHEILTGSMPDGRAYTDGRDHTCNNWTSEEEGNSPLRAANNTGPGAQVGKSDDSGPWNSQHISGGCSHEALARSHGAGLFYCFAIN
jgi:hypothetical protein